MRALTEAAACRVPATGRDHVLWPPPGPPETVRKPRLCPRNPKAQPLGGDRVGGAEPSRVGPVP